MPSMRCIDLLSESYRDAKAASARLRSMSRACDVLGFTALADELDEMSATVERLHAQWSKAVNEDLSAAHAETCRTTATMMKVLLDGHVEK